MGDNASHLQHLMDAFFLSHFAQHYLQDGPWTLLHLTTEQLSRTHSALRCASPDKATSPRWSMPAPKSLTSGTTSAMPIESNTPSQMYLMTPARPTSLSLVCPTTKTGQTGCPVSAGTVEDILLAVGMGITHLGQPDPHKVTPGAEQNHSLLTDFLNALSCRDPDVDLAAPLVN